jgi:hypothetical protein
MRDSKLFRLMRALRDEELDELYRILKKHNPRAQSLLKALRPYWPELDLEAKDEQTIYKQTFPTRNYSRQVLLNCKSELKKEIERFLVEQDLEQRLLTANRLLAESTVHRHPSAAGEDAANAFGKYLAESKHSFERYFEAFHYHILMQYSLGKPANSGPPTHLHDAMPQLDKGYLAWQLFCALESTNRNHYRAESTYQPPIELEASHWQSLITEEEPLLLLLNELYQLYQTPETAGGFEACFALLKRNAERLDELALLILARYLANFCTWRQRADEAGYRTTLLEVYRWAAAGNVFVYKGSIPHTLFMNIVITAVLEKDMELALYFMGSHKAYLPEVLRPDTLRLCQAYVHFHRAEYAAAREQLESIEKKEEYDFALRRQSLLLRTLYLGYKTGIMDYTDLVDRERAYRAFFERNFHNFSEGIKTPYLNLLYFTMRMAHYLNSFEQDPYVPKQLLDELEKKPCGYLRGWVEQEIGALMADEKG